MEKNKYPWELLSTSTLMQPFEILAYHIYKYEYYKNQNSSREATQELKIIASYTKQLEGEKEVCLKK